MLDSFRAKFQFLKKKAVPQFQVHYTSDGLCFFLPEKTQTEIEKTSSDELLVYKYQLVIIQRLLEDAQATKIKNGIQLTTEEAVCLDEDTREVFGVHPTWEASATANTKGLTTTESFQIHLSLFSKSLKTETQAFKIIGPVLRFTADEQYTLTAAQHQAFSALNQHATQLKTETNNLQLVGKLKLAKLNGFNFKFETFDHFTITDPSRVSVIVEYDAETETAEITPNFVGQTATPDEIQSRVQQLLNADPAAIRVNSEIVLFSEKTKAAVQEILRIQKLPKDELRKFIENPTLYLNSSLVDLETGFSCRVKGLTTFRAAYFGTTEKRKLDWFESNNFQNTLHAPSVLYKVIDSLEMLEDIETQIQKAPEIGAETIEVHDKLIDIREAEKVQEVLAATREHLQSLANVAICDESAEDLDENSQIVVDVALNDEDLEIISETIEKTLRDALYSEEKISWKNNKRTPFEHQKIGIQWLLGLTLESQVSGAVLADDMGLGKTYMCISALDHLLQEPKFEEHANKPTLLVVPLSLIDVWKTELAESLYALPFSDVVVLQSSADLKKYQAPAEAYVKYRLKVGSVYSLDRLDIPKRLVITTYSTFQRYHVSLCEVHWNFAIFDEAQELKNPNSLQSRAARGLQTTFMLLATGTPVENSLLDFWSLFDIASPGTLGGYQNFRKEYIQPILKAKPEDASELQIKLGNNLRRIVGAQMLRRTKEDNLAGLPKKIIYSGEFTANTEYDARLHQEMPSFQQKVYTDTLEAALLEKGRGWAFRALQKLQSISLHPDLKHVSSLVPRGTHSETLLDIANKSRKVIGILKVLQQIQQQNEKCLIFIRDRKLQEFMALFLQQQFNFEEPISIINGTTKASSKRDSDPTRRSLIQKFESKPGFNLIILSPVAAGVGLTIVKANHVYMLERHWNPAKESQAIDRVYRIGQLKTVSVYLPILVHPELVSFDVNLARLLSKKTRVRDSVVTTEPAFESYSEKAACLSTEAEDRSDGSQLFKMTAEKSNEAEKYLDIKDVDKLDGLTFEVFCALLLEKSSKIKHAMVTSASRDKGADIRLEYADGTLGFVQCKHQENPDKTFSNYNAFYAVHNAVSAYGEAESKNPPKLFVMTNAKKLKLDLNDEKFKDTNNIQFISRKDIMNFLKKAKISRIDLERKKNEPRYVVE
jgi:SNF2 family DNA or RNA helicase